VLRFFSLLFGLIHNVLRHELHGTLQTQDDGRAARDQLLQEQMRSLLWHQAVLSLLHRLQLFPTRKPPTGNFQLVVP
jgi:hypothetical protein